MGKELSRGNAKIIRGNKSRKVFNEVTLNDNTIEKIKMEECHTAWDVPERSINCIIT